MISAQALTAVLEARSHRFRPTVRAAAGRGPSDTLRATARRLRRFRRQPRQSRSRRVSGQRWQVESGFSRHKRLLGSAVRVRQGVNPKQESLPRVLTHHLMLLAAAEVFDRARKPHLGVFGGGVI